MGDRAKHPELAARAALARVLADEAKSLEAQARAILEPGLRPREQVVAELPDGTALGTVSRTRASTGAKVTDAKALLAWVLANRPDEIEQSVRPAFVDALKAQAKTHGYAFDVESGEIIPGIDVVEGSSSFRVSVDDSARDVVMARLADLVAGGMLALPAVSDTTGDEQQGAA